MAQETQPLLSAKHLDKIHKTENPVKKSKMYQRLFHKDSLRWEKRMVRYWKSQNDSISKAVESRQKALIAKTKRVTDGVNSKVYNTVYRPWAHKQAERHLSWLDKNGFKISPSSRKMLRNYLVHYFLNASQSESELYTLSRQIPDLPLPKGLSAKLSNYKSIHAGELGQMANGKLNGLSNTGVFKSLRGTQYESDLQKYGELGRQLSDTDDRNDLVTREGSRFANEYLGNFEGTSQLDAIKGQFGEAEKVKGLANNYIGKGRQLQDSSFMKNKAKEKTESIAMQYVAEHPEVMKGAQRTMSMLMKKYSVVPNSNDLSTAVRRTSLKGRTFFERLQVAANFQVISLDPISIDFAPQVGYKINARWTVGIGGLYRKTFTDSIPSVAADVVGYKVFSNYEILGNFFVAGEYARNSPGILHTETISKRLWENTLLAGIGRKFKLHPKLEMTLMAGYNFLYSNGDAVYPRPWVIRVGFQSSELAFLNKKRVQGIK